MRDLNGEGNSLFLCDLIPLNALTVKAHFVECVKYHAECRTYLFKTVHCVITVVSSDSFSLTLGPRCCNETVQSPQSSHLSHVFLCG